MYLLAFLCPPLAILLCGKPFQAMLSVPLCIPYFPSALWALLVVSDRKAWQRTRAVTGNADKNSKGQIKAMERQTREQVAAMERQRRELQRQTAELRRVADVVAPPELVEVRVAPVVLDPVQARKPLVTMARVRSALTHAKAGTSLARTSAISAYRELPEWAQPITWGLAVASPISLVIAVLFLSGK